MQTSSLLEINLPAVLRNYFVVALRSMRHHPAFAAINIVGLSVSMAVGLVLILFLRQAASQDEFHENADRLVRIYSDFKSASNRDNALYGTTPANLSDLMMREIPGVEQTAKVRTGFRGTLEYDGVGLPLNGIYADPAFFDLFSFEL
ncbi:MAG: putative ABC transport system permease protein, partial [Rhodothermales bacterium]